MGEENQIFRRAPSPAGEGPCTSARYAAHSKNTHEVGRQFAHARKALYSCRLHDSLNRIKAIAMDVDGVLTDGKIILGNNNIELKIFDVRDGFAISMAGKCGLKTAFITSRTSEAVSTRGKELKVDYVCQGVSDKLNELKKIATHEKIALGDFCYVGDDLADIELLKAVGFSATVADAPDEVKSCVSFVSSKQGGEGAIREIIEHILKAQEKWQ